MLWVSMGEKIYLAGRYSRRAELAEYAKDLEKLGAEITSTWLKGLHEKEEIEGPDELGLNRASWAKEDLYDIARSDALILFTNDTSAAGRGGAHAEFGIALASGKNISIVGPRTHVFCYLPDVYWWPNWGSTPWMQKPTVDLSGVRDNTNTNPIDIPTETEL